MRTKVVRVFLRSRIQLAINRTSDRPIPHRGHIRSGLSQQCTIGDWRHVWRYFVSRLMFEVTSRM